MLERLSKICTRDRLITVLSIILGNFIFALSVVMFILPNGLISGGTTGLALFLYRTFQIPMANFVFIFNGILFLIGWYFLGKKFAVSTVVSTLIYPVILDFLQRFPNLQMKLEDKFIESWHAYLTTLCNYISECERNSENKRSEHK